MTLQGLPEGFHARPSGPSDIIDVVELFRTTELADAGEAMTTADDLRSTWSMPGFDRERQTIVVGDGVNLVAYGDVLDWKAHVAVAPAVRGRGIGTAMLRWTEEATLRSRPAGSEARIGQTVVDDATDAAELLRRHGYRPRHTSWVLQLPHHVTIPHEALPEGYAIRPVDLGAEERQVYEVIEDAFNEWPNRTPSTLDAWRSLITLRSDFDASLLFVATHRDHVVGAAVGLIEPEGGWVHQVAVHRDHRRKGLGRELLRTTFETLRGRGVSDVGLSTDSRTGALDLYLGIGMVVSASYTHYSKLLRPAADDAPGRPGTP